MSQCRCKEIKECKEDLKKIDSAELDFSVLKIINGNVSTALEDIYSGCTQSFETSYMSEIGVALDDTIQPFISSIDQINTDLYNAKSEINDKKEAFIKEDDAYNLEECIRKNATITSSSVSNKGSKGPKK